jgi:hypothetical protein
LHWKVVFLVLTNESFALNDASGALLLVALLFACGHDGDGECC